MKTTLLLIILFLTNLATAATPNGYAVKVDVKDGSSQSSRHVLIVPGRGATVARKSSAKEKFIDVEVNEAAAANADTINLKLTVGTVDSSGKRTIISTKEISTTNNGTEQITVDSTKEGEPMTITLTPTRRTL